MLVLFASALMLGFVSLNNNNNNNKKVDVVSSVKLSSILDSGDIVSVFSDGSNYLVSTLGKNYKVDINDYSTELVKNNGISINEKYEPFGLGFKYALVMLLTIILVGSLSSKLRDN